MNKLCFEDLSNELLYEIFEFLDNYFIYETFSNLNIRFHYLIIRSSLPLKMNLSNISKSMFERYFKYILTPNIYRIVSLSLSNSLTIDHFLKILPIDVSFNRLESLTLNKIKTETLIPLLSDLAFLPRLFSLSIISIDNLTDENIIYQLIFRLPVLKYGKFLSRNYNQSFTLPIAADKQDQCLTMRHLITDGGYCLDQLITILYYIPLLNRLSCQCISGRVNIETDRPIVLFNITNISITILHSSFDQFQLLITNYFPKLQVLRIATQYDNTYLDAYRWEQLITRHIPHLRTFDFQYRDQIDDEDNTTFHALLDQFSSKFWHERKWFFAFKYYTDFDGFRCIFFSSQLYRNCIYDLYKDEKHNSCEYQNNRFNSTKHLVIHDYQMNTLCSLQFPDITKLTIRNNITRCIDLNRMIFFSQLNTLAIECHSLSVDMLLDFLYHAFNVHSLTLFSKPQLPPSIEQMNKACLISKNSKITKLYIEEICTPEHFCFFINLCPHLERLDTGVRPNNLEFVIRDLLVTSTRTCSHLFLLRLWTGYDDETVNKLRTMIDTEKLLNNYSIECIHGDVCLWW